MKEVGKIWMNGKLIPFRVKMLNEIGFVWDEYERRWMEEVQPALLAYREVYGDLRVPGGFVVPSEAPWPEACWEMKLGNTVHNIRALEHFVKDMRLALDECRRMKLILPGLELASTLYDKLMQQGHGRLGTQALMRVLADMNNASLPMSS